MGENAVETAIQARLSGGADLVALLGGTAIYNGSPPRGVALPWVTWSLASGLEENVTPARSQRLVYLVKGVAATLSAAGALAEEIDTLLHDQALSVSGATCFEIERAAIVRYREVDPVGHQIAHAGGEYLVRMEND